MYLVFTFGTNKRIYSYILALCLRCFSFRRSGSPPVAVGSKPAAPGLLPPSTLCASSPHSTVEPNFLCFCVFVFMRNFRRFFAELVVTPADQGFSSWPQQQSENAAHMVLYFSEQRLGNRYRLHRFFCVFSSLAGLSCRWLGGTVARARAAIVVAHFCLARQILIILCLAGLLN